MTFFFFDLFNSFLYEFHEPFELSHSWNNLLILSFDLVVQQLKCLFGGGTSRIFQLDQVSQWNDQFADYFCFLENIAV